MNIQDYIDSGIVENYAFGLSSPDEAAEFETLLTRHPELQEALSGLGALMEEFAFMHQSTPPAGTLPKIGERIRDQSLLRRSGGESPTRAETGTATQDF